MKTTTWRRRERGQTILLVAVSLVAILGLSALAIDVVTLYVSRAEAQRAADSGALAGAQMLVTAGVTADPCNAGLANSAVALATSQAQAVAQKNNIAGAPAQTIGVVFPNQGTIGTCPGGFGINPQVMVNLQRTGLPTFFSRIWGAALGSVSATATAEAYNPSNAGSVSTTGTVVPIAPRCPKPMLLPNCDPSGCGTTLMNAVTGAITNPGVIIGQSFMTMGAACKPGPVCVPNGPNPGQYYPLGLPSTALHLCPGCTSSSAGFQQDLECCNASAIACGQQVTVDYSVNPNGAAQEAATGGQCMIHESAGTGQDQLIQEFPAIFIAGSNNPFVGTSVQANDIIMTSDSVISVPVYDSTVGAPLTGSSVTIIGYLQLFINSVDNATGNFNATILNVSGCGNSLSTSVPAIQGAATSVPVRLIQGP
jgi:hypothetical protein